MPKWSAPFAILLLFVVSHLIDARVAQAQLFPRLRARINERINQSRPQPLAPQLRVPQPQTNVPSDRAPNSLDQPRQRQTALRPATPLNRREFPQQNAVSSYGASIGVDVLTTNTPANGLRVDGFSEGSFAERAGMKKGDVIIAIDSIGTPTIASVSEILQQKRAGETVVVRVVRDRLAGNLTIPLIARTIAAEPERRQRTGEPTLAAPLARSPSGSASDNPLAELGIEVENSSVARGIEVTRVATESNADRVGLRQGDRIVSLDGAMIRSVESFGERLIQRNPEQPANLQVVRQNRLLTVTLPNERQIAASRSKTKPSSEEPQRSVLESNSLMKGVGAAFGGLFGGSDTKQPENESDQQPKKPSDEFALEDEISGSANAKTGQSIDQAGFEQIETPEPFPELPSDVPQPRAFE